MAKFCFFTDPTKLAPQQASEAFGAMPPADGNDRYRVSDLHSAVGTAPVVAICDGLLCAQRDESGTLSLVLKPIEQPPFDFPAIAYFIYKGVDPASLLAGASVDVAKAADNDLIRQVDATWLAPVNGNSGDPPGRCLGLHLTPASNTADFPDLDLGQYADSEPLDNLFYRGDPEFQLPLVRSGWRLGDFSAAGPFGLEIIVDTAAYAPRIRLARRVENLIEVGSLDAGLAYQPYEAAYFMHWHAKEEVLHFVDPCAFWGSFYHAKLRVVAADGSADRKKGGAIYADLLRGSHDDQTPIAGLFYNRNKVYLDIRNEHNRSFDYYKTNGRQILVTLDVNESVDDCAHDYHRNDWPLYTLDQSDVAGGISTDRAKLRIAFYTNNFSKLGIFKPPDDLARAVSASSRRLVELVISGQQRSQPVSLRIPSHGPTHRTIARYVGLTTRFDDPSIPSGHYGATGPYPWSVPTGVPLPRLAIAFERDGSAALRTYPDPCALRLREGSPQPLLCNIGWIRAGLQAVLFVVPAGAAISDMEAPSPSYSGETPGNAPLSLANRLAKPRTIVARDDGNGHTYLDYAFPARGRVPDSSWSSAMLFLSGQDLDAIRQCEAAVATLVVAPGPPGTDATVALEIQGLQQAGEIVKPFRQTLGQAVPNAPVH
ncbi:MAG: hypothetical protein QOG72_365 [Sphingomonadales bacterium]|nr:hypothetical protein [Sphingomonadales bacterium]